MPAQTHWSVPRKQLPIVKKLRASQLRCAPGYRHNDITVLIIGNPNMGTTTLSTCAELRIIVHFSDILLLSLTSSLFSCHFTQWWAHSYLLHNWGFKLSSSSSCWGWILSSSFRNNVANVSRSKVTVVTTWYFFPVDLNDVQRLYCSGILMQFLDLQPAPFHIWVHNDLRVSSTASNSISMSSFMHAVFSSLQLNKSAPRPFVLG